MKYVSLVAGGISLFSLTALSADVSPREAARAAEAWIDAGASLGALDAKTVSVVESGADGAFHLVCLEGGGYVVMPADDRIDPVTFFTPSGERPQPGDPAWEFLVRDLAARRRAAGVQSGARTLAAAPADDDGAARTPAQARWDALLGRRSASSGRQALMTAPRLVISDLRVKPLVDSRWNQLTHDNTINGYPCYNYWLASISPDLYCGCVATAMGQIMRYFRHPTAAVTRKNFTVTILGKQKTLTILGGPYQWDRMAADPAHMPVNDDNWDSLCEPIGTLTYDLAIASQAKFMAGATSVALLEERLRLKDTFGYGKAGGLVFCENYPYTAERFRHAVLTSLDARSPVAMSLTRETSAHTVIADGYGFSDGQLFVHLNFGWGGLDDAWYQPPEFDTTSYDYDAIHSVVFSISPTDDATKVTYVSGRVVDRAGCGVANVKVKLYCADLSSQTTASDEHGVYSFRVSTKDADRKCDVVAWWDDLRITNTVTLVKNQFRQLAQDKGDYYAGKDYAPVIGNLWGVDLVLPSSGELAETPTVDPGDCLFHPTTNVTVSSRQAGAVFRYTLDGTDPSETSSVYAAPVTVTTDTVFKVRAWVPGKSPSRVASSILTYDLAAMAPLGDYYSRPVEIFGASGETQVADVSAFTREQWEPSHSFGTGELLVEYETAWFSWAAPGSGEVRFAAIAQGILPGDPMPQDFPLCVAVYEGAPESVRDVRLLTSSADYKSTGDYSTRVQFTAKAGETYRIAVATIYPLAKATKTKLRLGWSGSMAAPVPSILTFR